MTVETSWWTIVSSISTFIAAIFTGLAAVFTRRAAQASWASVDEMSKERAAERKDREEIRQKERPLLQLVGVHVVNNTLDFSDQPDYSYVITLGNTKKNKLLRMSYVLAFLFKNQVDEHWLFLDPPPLHLHGTDQEKFKIHANINDIKISKMKEVEIAGFFKLIDVNRSEDNYVCHAMHKIVDASKDVEPYIPQQSISIQVVEGGNIVDSDFGVVSLHLDVNDAFVNRIQANVGAGCDRENCAKNETISSFIRHVYEKSDARMDYVLFD